MPLDPNSGEFLRDLIHDLVNPLSSLVGFLDLLLAPDAKDPLAHRQRRMLVAMDRTCIHFLGMMRDLSDLSRMEESLWTPAPETVDWRALAERVLANYAVLAQNRRITLALEAPPGQAGLASSVDPQMAEHFLDTLLRASGRLTPEGGRITLRLRPGVSGEMEHTGSGRGDGESRSTEAWESAFNASLRGPRPPEGYAVIGLALARRIARLHGGAVEAAPRPDGGTLLRFHFPA